MKIGIRKPSISKSLSARNPMTQVKRKYSTKKYTDPIGTMKKRTYNKVYNKTTTSVKDLGKSKSYKSSSSGSYRPSRSSSAYTSNYDYNSNYNNYDYNNSNYESFTEELNRVCEESKERADKMSKEIATEFYILLSISIIIGLIFVSPLLYILFSIF